MEHSVSRRSYFKTWIRFRYHMVILQIHCILLAYLIIDNSHMVIHISFICLFFVCVVFRCTAYIETSDKFVLYAYCENKKE